MSLVYPRDNVPSGFDYPEDRLYLLKITLAAAKIKDPNSQDIKGALHDSSSSAGTQHAPPSVVLMGLGPTNAATASSATSTRSKRRCTRTTTNRVPSLAAATLELPSSVPTMISSPSSPAVLGRPILPTSPTAPPWSGSGMPSSKPSSPTPSSSSTSPSSTSPSTTRLVSFPFCFHHPSLVVL